MFHNRFRALFLDCATKMILVIIFRECFHWQFQGILLEGQQTLFGSEILVYFKAAIRLVFCLEALKVRLQSVSLIYV